MLKMISRHCVVCGCEDKRIVHQSLLPAEPLSSDVIHDQYADPGAARWWRYRVVRCLKCGHYYADPVADPNSVESSYLAQQHDNQFGVRRDILLKTNRGYADLIRPFLPAARDLQVDIGCDTGVFLEASSDMGFARRVGIEPGKAAAAAAGAVTGVDIHQKLFDPADFIPKSIQLLSMIHVLDHLIEPIEFMRTIHSLMDHNGIVLVVVHNIRSALARLAGKNWSPIGVMHFDYFTPHSLRQTLVLAGFKIDRVVHTWNYFPLSHLIRFAPGLTPRLRSILYRTSSNTLLRHMVLGLPLGNIAVIAHA